MGKGKVAQSLMSSEFVVDCLGLPEGTTILGVTWDPFAQRMMLAVRHDDLRDVSESEPIPYVIWTRHAPDEPSTWKEVKRD